MQYSTQASDIQTKVVLASQSPRRQQLLAQLGMEFTVRIPQVDETYPDSLPASQVAEYLACKKADAALDELQDDELLIAADTVVVSHGIVLGKPASLEEARAMLHRLSGSTHQVYTGVCLLSMAGRESFTELTEVTFRHLSEQMIAYYLEKDPPLDKAGAYGIQDWIGLVGVQSIKGSYFNVMGLPTDTLYFKLHRLLDPSRSLE